MLYMIYTLLLTFQAVHLCWAATPCKKDACYNAVANNAADRPNLASRQADCSAVLKKVIDDDATSTSTTLTTSTIVSTFITDRTITATDTITTTLQNKRELPQETLLALLKNRLLEERDKVSGLCCSVCALFDLDLIVDTI